MAEAQTNRPTYVQDGEMHRATWPKEETRLEVTRVVLDPYNCLLGSLAAYSGENLLNESEGLLMSDTFREAFIKGCAQMNGHVAWRPRVLYITRKVSESLHGTAQSARDFWADTSTVPEFLAKDFSAAEQSLVEGLVYPGCITVLAAPRGLGKSTVATALAIALATGGVFRDATLATAPVLILDRDNPPRLVQERLRHWGGEAAIRCHIRTREQVPLLTDRAKWAALPAERYRVIILDSLLSLMEGITEKEPKQVGQILATLKDLAHRGPGILALHNTIKSGDNYRGRGELADSIDILYEARDVTGWTLESTGPWWEQLPEAGEQHWATRATRRQESQCLRLACVPSKFRLGIEPKPFILELDMRQPPWTLREVTTQVTQEAETTAQTKAAAQKDTIRQAITALQAEVSQQAHADRPLTTTAAEVFLRNQHLTRQQARNIINSHAKTHWMLVHRPDLHGHPTVLLPVEEKNCRRKDDDAADPQKTSSTANDLYADGPQSDRRKDAFGKASSDAVERDYNLYAEISPNPSEAPLRDTDADLPPGRMTFARPARREGGAS